MSKNKTLKKVIAFSSALVISSSLLTGCGADPPQEQYRDSDKEDITIVNHDSGSLAISGQIVLEVVVRTFLHCFLGLPCVLVVCSTATRGTRGNL